MNDEKWLEVVGRIKDDFEVLADETQDMDPGPGSIEVIEFRGPAGRIKLERISRPIVTGQKVIGSRRIGSSTHVEFTYSETEKSHTVKAYRWDEARSDWSEIQGDVGAFKL
jgi:hypothetical protein